MIVHPVSTSHNHDAVYAPIGSTGGVTVQDEGTPLTARGTINFTGDGVSAADDAVNERTNVTITGGGVTDHGALTGLSDDDHTQYVKHSLATAVSDFLVASGAGAFVKKTLAEVKAILGLGSAAYTDSTAYLAASGKAADSDKLDGHDTSYFATADHMPSVPYKAKGYLPTAEQSNLVNGVWTLVNLTAKLYDTNNNFDTVNKKYVVPVNGYYLVIGAVQYVNPVANARYAASVYADGVATSTVVLSFSVASFSNVQVTDIIYLTEGQEISLYARSSSGDNTVDINYGSQNTFLSICLISV